MATTTVTTDKFIKFYPAIAKRLGSVNAAILYMRLWDIRNLGGRADGFVYKSGEELTKETGLSRREQEGARKLLIGIGWLEVRKMRAHGHATLHYKVLTQIVEKKPKTNAPNVQTSNHLMSKLDAPKRQTNNTRQPLDNSLDRAALAKAKGMGN